MFIVTFVFSGALPASAQQTTEGLQQELQALKTQYEKTTQQLQGRIAALEQQKEAAEKKQATVSASELAQEAAKQVALGQSGQVGANYQGKLPSDPTYDLIRDADTKIATPRLKIVGNMIELNSPTVSIVHPKNADPFVPQHLMCCSPCFNRHMEILADLEAPESRIASRSQISGIADDPLYGRA